jgi:hypothetical protein
MGAWVSEVGKGQKDKGIPDKNEARVGEQG